MTSHWIILVCSPRTTCLKENWLPPSPRGHQLPVTLQLRWNCLYTPLSMLRFFPTSVFHRPRACCHSQKRLCAVPPIVSGHTASLSPLLALRALPSLLWQHPVLSCYSLSYSWENWRAWKIKIVYSDSNQLIQGPNSCTLPLSWSSFLITLFLPLHSLPPSSLPSPSLSSSPLFSATCHLTVNTLSHEFLTQQYH